MMTNRVNKLDIAKQLATITGKPIEEFLDGIMESDDGKRAPERQRSDSRDVRGNTASDNEDESICNTTETRHSDQERIQDDVFLGEYVNGKVMYGRKMTRKEYREYTKGKTQEEIFKSPYLYKMFRAEGQNEVFFPRWIDSFPKEKK
jgi:hypothetical protein